MKVLFPLMCLAAACDATSPPPQEPASELSGNSKSDGGSWCHANLSSTNDTQMVFDYEVAQKATQLGELTYAGHGWLNVKSSAFQPADSVEAVVLTYEYNAQLGPNVEASQQNIYTLPLDYQDGRFTVNLADLPISLDNVDDGSFIPAYYWELAVNANGTWYKDASTGNNLQFMPALVSGYCAQGHSL